MAKVKHSIGDSVTYEYILKDAAPVMHECRSYGEACSWATLYERQGLISWGRR